MDLGKLIVERSEYGELHGLAIGHALSIIANVEITITSKVPIDSYAWTAEIYRCAGDLIDAVHAAVQSGR